MASALANGGNPSAFFNPPEDVMPKLTGLNVSIGNHVWGKSMYIKIHSQL